MESTNRLDELVAKAKRVFERKHGTSSSDCFGAFSPAKVNLMGDNVESCGGLVLQVALDRRVVVYGRGRVLPENHFPKQSPQGTETAAAASGAVDADAGGGGAGRASGHGSGGSRHEGGGSGSRHGGGGGGSRHGGGGGSLHGGGRSRFGGGAAMAEVDLLKPLSSWSVHRRKTTAKVMDTMVQDLVFGRRARKRCGTEPTGAWMKDAHPSAPTESSGGAGGNGGQSSRCSTPTTRFDSSSSIYALKLSAPTIEEIRAKGTIAPDKSAVHGRHEHVNMARSASDVTARTPSTLGPSEPSATNKSSQPTDDYGFGAESGSTSAEEAFSADASRNGRTGRSFSAGGAGGGIGAGSNGDKDRGKMQQASNDSTDTDSTEDAIETVKSGAAGVFAAAAAALAAAKAAAAAAGVSDPAAVGVGTAAAFSREHGRLNGDGDGLDGRLPSSHPLLFAGSVSSDMPDDLDEIAQTEESDVRGALALSGIDDEDRSSTFADPQVKAKQTDSEFARAKAEAAQAIAEIQAAEAADKEAKRARTCRIFCEACPTDGVVEFVLNREMRGGGDSWKGLVTAVAAEYAQELPAGRVVGVEAVVVSDVPGSGGEWGMTASAAAATAGTDVDNEVVGKAYGWANAARCALLIATATFLEEALGMRPFPRMKAMRCYSASLRCRRSAKEGCGPAVIRNNCAETTKDEPVSEGTPGGRSAKEARGATPKPFASEEPLRIDIGGGEAGGRTAPGSGDDLGEEMGLDDLLAIADGDSAGAMLVDTKWRTWSPVPVRGPNGGQVVIVVAQPLAQETAKRLRSQAEQERRRRSATGRAVLGVARERHPEALCLRDVPAQTLEALISVGTARGQIKAMASAGIAAGSSGPSAGDGAEGRGPPGTAGGGGGGGGGGGSSLRRSGGRGSRRRLTPEVLTHARHLANEVQRVAEVAAYLSIGDMEAVGRLMMQSRRSAGLTVAGTRGRQEPPTLACKLATMVARLPGVYGSSQSDGRGGGAGGTVVALVDPAGIEGVLRAIITRGPVTTGVPWSGFVARPGGGSGIIRDV